MGKHILTEAKYKQMGFTVKSKFVLDSEGNKYFPKKAKTPLRAIRYFCLECMGWERRKGLKQDKPFDDVRECTDPLCPLFDFRFSKNPHSNRKGNMDNLKKAHLANIAGRGLNENGLKPTKRGKGMGNGKKSLKTG